VRLLIDILSHPANKRAPLGAAFRAVQWQTMKRLTGRAWDIPYHGLRLRCYPWSHSASRAIYFSGLPDYWEMCFMRDYLRPGDVFIDAGANVGLYTILACALVGSAGHVHAFEPTLPAAQSLLESIQLNDLHNVSVHQVGLGEFGGYAKFDATNDDCTGHITSANLADAGILIPIERLDQRLKDIPYAMAKFDIEGYEPLAIRGASSLLRNGNPPVLLIEMGGYSKRHGVTTSDFIAELDHLGYTTAIYSPGSKTLEKTITPWQIPVDNVLAISRDRMQFVEGRLGGNGKN
jgi:FkbM family methyltransferase